MWTETKPALFVNMQLSAVLINKTLNIIVVFLIIKCINYFLSALINLFLGYAICYTKPRH